MGPMLPSTHQRGANFALKLELLRLSRHNIASRMHSRRLNPEKIVIGGSRAMMQYIQKLLAKIER